MGKEKYLPKIVAIVKEDGLVMPMEVIADKIGVTKKTLYNRFISKDLLIDDCIAYMNEELRACIACMADPEVPASEGFRRGLLNMKEMMYSISHVFLRDLQVAYPAKANDDHVISSQLIEDMILKNLQNGIAQGEYSDDLDVKKFAHYIKYSIFSFFVKEVLHGRSWAADDYFDDVIKYHTRALRK